MIVKIRNSEAGWSFFEADQVENYTDRFEDANYQSLDCGGGFFGNKDEHEPSTTVNVVLIFRKGKLVYRIIAQLSMTIYLLNNEGKTVERIS